MRDLFYIIHINTEQRIAIHPQFAIHHRLHMWSRYVRWSWCVTCMRFAATTRFTKKRHILQCYDLKRCMIYIKVHFKNKQQAYCSWRKYMNGYIAIALFNFAFKFILFYDGVYVYSGTLPGCCVTTRCRPGLPPEKLIYETARWLHCINHAQKR